ncbi:MAG: site-specific integrase [Prevotellaceae bacterium]|jgi:site-specific recombinase XerD|nr:site-specific integrase [Prevotellaceae bacterium]
MATFKIVSRTKKEYNAVYIRISHKSVSDYIKTEFTVHKSGLNKKNEIADHFVLAHCAVKIRDYYMKLNMINSEYMTVGEIRKYLEKKDANNLSFTDFAEKFISGMRNDFRDKSAGNYKVALNSLKKYYRKENIAFSEITRKDLQQWIKSLEKTARVKQLYPVCIKKMFDEGCDEFNDDERNIVRITNQPFRKLKIPRADTPKERYAEVETIQKIISTIPIGKREELSIDVAKMVIYLAGMNLIDLYNIEKQEFKNGKLCYNRSKEEKVRNDKAYFEIKVAETILPLIEKYSGKKNLLNFRERYANADNLTRAVNTGLKKICQRADIQKITVYWLRHTWATIAKTKCGFSDGDVAFGLNHVSAHKVTEKYIKKDFSLIDRMNEAVCKFIFGE